MSADAAKCIDEERLWRRHMQMAEHGATAAGGVNRQALSAADIAAQKTLIGWGEQIGLVAAAEPEHLADGARVLVETLLELAAEK